MVSRVSQRTEGPELRGPAREAARVLAVTRYSGDDDTGAMARQRGTLDTWIAEQGHMVAGWVEDETVSGSVNLDERKSLGQWLAEPKLSEWDTMAVTTQDRVTRDDLHWWIFVGRLSQWGKQLVVLDDPSLDLSTPNGRMIAGVKATQAANYRLDVKNKARKARETFRQQRRFPGGWWPYGHRAEPREDGQGWQLVIDPDTSERVREAVQRITNGDSLRMLCRDWNRRGVPTARDHQLATTRLKPGETRREPRGHRWNETSLKRVLQNPTIMGFAAHGGELIREDGVPVQWADPIVTTDEYQQVQETLNQRKRPRRAANRSPLLGVVFCACGKPLHHQVTNSRNKTYTYYRCGSAWSSDSAGGHNRPCVQAWSWPEHMLNNMVEQVFLTDVGPDEVMKPEFQPGDNHDAEIESLREAVDHLSGNLANLPPDSRAAKTTIDRIGQHETRLNELEAEPGTPSGWNYVGTGETWAEWWRNTPDWHDRGAGLLRAGVRLTIGGTRAEPSVELVLPTGGLGRQFPGFDTQAALHRRFEQDNGGVTLLVEDEHATSRFLRSLNGP